MNSYKYVVVLNLLLVLFPVLAAQKEQWVFRSQYDQFKLIKNENKFTLDGAEIQGDLIKRFLPLFETPIVGECPSALTHPDLEVKIINEENKKEKKEHTNDRSFYLAAKQIKEGDHCGDLDGEGLYYLPLHRSWFTGPQEGHIDVGDQITIEKEGTLFGEFVRSKGEWKNKNESFFTNWDLFNQFIETLSKYDISGRLHPLATQNKSEFQVKTNGKTYRFFQMSDNLWALQRPDKEWLFASPSFSFLLDMSSKMWKDRYSDALSIIKDDTKTSDERVRAVQKLGVAWSPSIKMVFHSILLNSDEDSHLKKEIVLSMKQKPTLENFGVLIKALKKTQDAELLNQYTLVLRLRNRNGLIIDSQSNSDDDERTKAIADWEKWWAEQSQTPAPTQMKTNK